MKSSQDLHDEYTQDTEIVFTLMLDPHAVNGKIERTFTIEDLKLENKLGKCSIVEFEKEITKKYELWKWNYEYGGWLAKNNSLSHHFDDHKNEDETEIFCLDS